MEKCYDLIPFHSIIADAVAMVFPSTISYLAIGMHAGGGFSGEG